MAHPPQQIGRKGLSNRRWIVGGKLCLVLNHWGLIVDWACDTANVSTGTSFQTWLNRQRRVSKDYERLPATSEAFIYVAMIRLMVKRLAH